MKEQKFVFLIEDEICHYPIDFQKRFGICYDRYPLKPVGLREINRMIWHMQLSTHNGGDFFNEIFDAHPNLLCFADFFHNVIQDIVTARESLKCAKQGNSAAAAAFVQYDEYLGSELLRLADPTDKDILLFLCLSQKELTQFLDPNSRIAPVFFFQPHFPNVDYIVKSGDSNYAILDTDAMQQLRSSSLIQSFKYIKTFSPLRRFTTSYGGAVRYALVTAKFGPPMQKGRTAITSDSFTDRILTRSFLCDPGERICADSVIVRFEDGKTNPEATLKALADFLDIPYTESMAYCSSMGLRDPGKEIGDDAYAAGFSLSSVYKTYDDLCGDEDRRLIEFFLREAYEFYGYDFHYYDGMPMDEGQVLRQVEHFPLADRILRETQEALWKKEAERDGVPIDTEEREDALERRMEQRMHRIYSARKEAVSLLMREVTFVNEKGEPLQMMRLLKPIPNLLAQEIYH